MSVYLEQFGIWVSDEEAAAIAALPPAATPPTVPVTGQTLTGTSYSRESGKAIVAGILRTAGLNPDSPAFTTYINDLLTTATTQEDLSNRLLADVYDKTSVPGQEIAARYPAIFTRLAQGKTPISVGDYQRLKDTYTQVLTRTGLTPYVQADTLIDQWIGSDTSPAEVQDRVEAVTQAVFQEPPEVRAEMQRLFGVADSVGAATAYFLDPAGSVPKIQQQLRQAEIGGASVRSGFGLLTAEESRRLAEQGVTADQAQQGFGTLAGLGEVVGVLPGEQANMVGRDTLLRAAFNNDAAAQDELERKRRARLAVFGAGGGGFGTTPKGVSGLGSAAT